MPKVHFVKSARKPIPHYGIAVGDSYYHWAFMIGGRGGPKICSKERPSRSQLTNSDFLRSVYDIQDKSLTTESITSADDLRGVADDEIAPLGTEQQEKFDNMPDNLQQGDTGQLLEERANQCESWADSCNTVADDLEQKLTELEELETRVNAWKAYHAAMEAAENEDGDDETEGVDEPTSEEPDEGEMDTDFDDERRSLIDDALGEIDCEL